MAARPQRTMIKIGSIMVLMIWIAGCSPDYDALADSYLAPYPIDSLGESTILPELQASAVSAYRMADYPTATALFDSLAVVDGRVQWFFYLALGEVILGELGDAEPRLRLIKNSATPYAEPARWYLALLHLKDERPEEAKPWLEEIVATEGHYRREDAKVILEKL